MEITGLLIPAMEFNNQITQITIHTFLINCAFPRPRLMSIIVFAKICQTFRTCLVVKGSTIQDLYPFPPFLDFPRQSVALCSTKALQDYP